MAVDEQMGRRSQGHCLPAYGEELRDMGGGGQDRPGFRHDHIAEPQFAAVMWTKSGQRLGPRRTRIENGQDMGHAGRGKPAQLINSTWRYSKGHPSGIRRESSARAESARALEAGSTRKTMATTDPGRRVNSALGRNRRKTMTVSGLDLNNVDGQPCFR